MAPHREHKLFKNLSYRQRYRLISNSLNLTQHRNLVESLPCQEQTIKSLPCQEQTINSDELDTSISVNIKSVAVINSNQSDISSLNVNSPKSKSVTSPSACFNYSNFQTDTYDSKHNVFSPNNVDEGTSREDKLKNSLRLIFSKPNVSQAAVGDILKALVSYGIKELPTDARSLMKTPRNISSEITSTNGGQYCHIGITNGLKNLLINNFRTVNEINLDINIDGLPISKSSLGQFWPILASIADNENFYTEPFPVGIYYGQSKPSDSNLYLKPMVEEMKALMEKGLNYNGNIIKVGINAIICDAPARAFICGIKGHSGYFGCPKCTTEGDFIENRVVFPDLNSQLRTNDTFRNRNQPEHHREFTILEELDIDMIAQIPNDPMHLVYLGVTKRLLQFWIHGKMDIRLNKEKNHILESRNTRVVQFIPKEFSRLPRKFLEVDRWKATEFRLFTLYTGIVLLKGVLSKALYTHFLCYSSAIRILSDENLSHLLDYAEQNLRYFVEKYSVFYGSQYISYNVHCLIHLSNDVRKFGCLHKFSAFKFENFMYKIKQKLKTSGKPLQQIVNRLKEEDNLKHQKVQEKQEYPEIHVSNNVITSVRLRDFIISPKSPNNVYILKTGQIVFINNLLLQNGEILMQYRYFSKSDDYFIIPCKSSVIGIYSVDMDNLSTYTKTSNISSISRKCVKLPDFENSNKYVITKILH